MYAWLSTVIKCAQKRAIIIPKYALGEPKLDVKDMYVKEIILSHLLARSFWDVSSK